MGKCKQKRKNENSVSKTENTEMTHTKSCPRLSGKVSALADERGKLEQKRKRILTCVRTLAPITSQGSALPSEFGGS